MQGCFVSENFELEQTRECLESGRRRKPLHTVALFVFLAEVKDVVNILEMSKNEIGCMFCMEFVGFDAKVENDGDAEVVEGSISWPEA